MKTHKIKCPDCNGTGLATKCKEDQSEEDFPEKCEMCQGTGKIEDIPMDEDMDDDSADDFIGTELHDDF